MHRQYKRLIVGVLFILLVAGGFILYLSWPLLTGTTAVLETLPIDPFDPLRGQYITINYKIGTLPAPSDITEGDTVYITLKKDVNGTAQFEKLSESKPKDSLFIKGEVESTNGEKIRVRYGIEQYFFERNAYFPTNNIFVKVKIDSRGQARIIELLQNGKPVVIDYKNASFLS
ncbi:MAG: GDYXXLXY domain-containing protein [Candidatus Vogelbacteria bacterium]|nr:GDYXXLXY domain-containing protein [Candidatus Vogelbacteria bacterium]